MWNKKEENFGNFSFPFKLKIAYYLSHFHQAPPHILSRRHMVEEIFNIKLDTNFCFAPVLI
jgi:hypothetical protein